MMHFRLFAILLLLVAGSTTVVSGQTQQEPALDMEFTDIPLSEAIPYREEHPLRSSTTPSRPTSPNA